MPAQVGARWAGGRGPGSSRRSRTFSVRLAARLPAGAFRPPAPLPTVVLRIERHALGAADPNAPPDIGQHTRAPTVAENPSSTRMDAMTRDDVLAACAGLPGAV